MAPNSKRVKRVDKISTLPNEVLCHILSFLPTLYAVRTSLLSKRWKNLWTSLPVLEFDDDKREFGNSDGCNEFDDDDDSDSRKSWNKSRFVSYVDRVIALHDSSSSIRKLTLHVQLDNVESADLQRIGRSICTAIEHNTVELDLALHWDEHWEHDPFPMPQSFFLFKTLVVLKVNVRLDTKDLPRTGCFPKLKVLWVVVSYPCDQSFANLLNCCPKLEDMTIQGMDGFENLDLNISAPELKKLEIVMDLELDKYPTFKFFIKAPKLENLDITDDYFWSHYILENGDSIVNANIILQNCYDDLSFADRTAAILAKISKVRYLSFDAHLFQKASNLRKFVCLSQLKLHLYGRNRWELLLDFLRRSPVLEHLVIKLKDRYMPDLIWDRDERERACYSPPQVPVSLSPSLKTISIEGFKGYQDEIEVANYLLQNGKNLNSMTITCTEEPRSMEGLKSSIVKFIYL